MPIFLLLLNCTSGSPKTVPVRSDSAACSDTWIFTANVTERKVNDSVTQQVVDGRVWFEVIAPRKQSDGSTRALIRDFRMDGSLLSEGYAVYWVHPVADYTEEGVWKYYDCKGKLRRP